MKVLHCPNTVAGNPYGLASAERELGLASRAISFRRSPYGYPVDEVLGFSDSYIRNEWKRWRLIARMLTSYDVVHYNFGTWLAPDPLPLTPGRFPAWAKRLFNSVYAAPLHAVDLKLAKSLGKVIAVTFQGDDARQGDYCRAHYTIHFAHEVGPDYYNAEVDAATRTRIETFGRYANLIYALNPDLLAVLPQHARFLPYACVDLREWQPSPPAQHIATPHLVHAPSNRDVKGTRYLEEAVARLEADGIAFRYTRIENMENSEARLVYATADLLVDQLLAGFYGGLAVELMALAKPVVCYLRESDLAYLPSGMASELPVINATPESIYSVLRMWLTDRKHELRARGIAGREYVERWHDPLKIAAGLKVDYEAARAQR